MIEELCRSSTQMILGDHDVYNMLYDLLMIMGNE